MSLKSWKFLSVNKGHLRIFRVEFQLLLQLRMIIENDSDIVEVQ